MTIIIKYTIEENEIGVGIMQDLSLQSITGTEEILCARLIQAINKMTEEIQAERDAFTKDTIN